ncbi:nucleoside triphosphate pyrophosphohydrolase [uncultured Mycolicibacterium sp.]|uniref:nucleoside triphosphate pyrophosphohydrolase n=1 Tax=uncultured Mycolicibacterium sp. TaxID=2320817 RepID=UPI00261C235B|nr:nucleoside triphosphate pyrophosphohydrolase [uncultured Mycolicibacterium sp.]
MTVVLVDPRRPALIPVEAVELLTGDVQYTEEIPIRVPWSLPSARPWLADAGDTPAPVLLSSDRDHPAVQARLAAGERLIAAPDPLPGERLLDAVAMMDRLRTDGPWESEQTHESLCRYLLEEAYELFDAVRDGDPGQLCEELGDLLLQVLFHARIAEDAAEGAFGIDDVADALVRKLGNRAPAVLSGQSVSLEEQLAQWEERKAREKAARARAAGRSYTSLMDGVPTALPALALAAKAVARAEQGGVPEDLIPKAIRRLAGDGDKDFEHIVRNGVLDFIDTVRRAEAAIAAARGADAELDEVVSLDGIDADEWRAHWPAGDGSAEQR